MAAATLTSHEAKAKYRAELRSLTGSCDDYYDNGAQFEAYKIANIIKSIVYDSHSSPSLLTQLRTKSITRFLDSRSAGSLVTLSKRNGIYGLQPRTRLTTEAYGDQHLFVFDEWWEGQTFRILGNTYNRKLLIGVVAHKLGGADIDPEEDTRVDIATNLLPGFSMATSVSKSGASFCAELSSVCAIGEELLFSLTPEPTNRERMLWEPLQERLHFSPQESEMRKKTLRSDLSKLHDCLRGEVSSSQKSLILNAQKIIKKTLEIDCLNSEDARVMETVDFLMTHTNLPWTR